jgi:TetR/AcrR family transcriptional repressor of lmrAB and yxaGH operons
MAKSARQRMIESAALLMREHGVEATSFSQVLAHSGGSRGSIYHYFPGGKAQLIEEATRHGGDFIAAGITAALEQEDALTALDVFAQYWLGVLRDSDFAAGCPVVAGALEGDRTPGAREAAGDAFQSWENVLADALRRRGLAADRARAMATLVFAAIEGATIFARAEQSTAPLERVVAELRTVLRQELDAAQTQ